MATTCKLIAKNVLGSDTASVTFSDIPGTFSDLYVICSVRSSRSTGDSDNILMQFNSSTTSYTWRWLYGTGSAALSGSGSDTVAGIVNQDNDTASTFTPCEFYIPNYAGSTNKSWSGTQAQEKNASASVITAIAGLWSNTAAITSILFKPSGSNNWKSGSSFYLYGITKA